MTGCGYTPAQVDALTISEVRDLFSYWTKFPPTHELIRLQIGYKPPPTPQELQGQATINQGDMAAMLEASGGRITRRLPNG